MIPNATDLVTSPSGKDAAYENFPVGSWLLPGHLRPHVAAFYAFARTIDDIADSPNLEPPEKVRRLDGFDRAIVDPAAAEPGYESAVAMRRCLDETGITARHCHDLIDAFKQDAVKLRYRDWAELIDYCDRSAAPVGRFLLDLHGGSRSGYAAADALCNALQIINHLQDCQDDYRALDRVYLPTDWMETEGTGVTELDRPRTTDGLRRVLDRCLDGVDALLQDAAALPGDLNDRRLAMEAGAILEIARTLSGRLRRGDPLARRIALSKLDYALCVTRGALFGAL
jgi:hydroxysqualene synthase